MEREGMEREEKVKGGERERGELMGQKLESRIFLGKREGNSTPSPTWKYGFSQDTIDSRNTLSARKLGANLWEMQAQLNPRAGKMNTRRGPRSSHPKQDDVFEAQAAPSPSKQPENGISSRKQLKPSFYDQPSRRVEKVEKPQQPISPASYLGSMEMAPHWAPLSPNGSAHGLKKTSTELLKVLNRIWTLEEKHALDMSLVEALKRDLGQARARIQELLQERKRARNEIADLTAQITGLKCAWEELSGVKSSFSDATRELESERRGRALVEDLCDEFARGIIGYERESRLAKQSSPANRIPRNGENDRFVLHISEAWLDERAQSRRAFSREHSPLDKLRPEIEAFLREKKTGILNGPTCPPRASKDECCSSGKGHFGNLGAECSKRNSFEPGLFTGPSSPVKKWVSMVSGAGPKMGESGSSSRWSRGVKPNTLKAKLIEVRLEGRQSRASRETSK